MKPLRKALAALLLAALPAAAQDADPPVPVPDPDMPAMTFQEAYPVPPVMLKDVKIQAIGEERLLEELPPGLIFLDASTGKVMVADENDPHGRFVCACRDIDWHSLTNDLKVNGHRILLNDAFSLQAEGGAVSLRHGTNSLLQILAADHGSLAPLTAAYEDPAHLLLTANAPADAVLQTTTNLLDPAGWQPATNAVVAETTDAATTWRITLLDGTAPEFYRVLADVAREAGIYANAQLHAEAGVVVGEGQGIEMAGERWNEWPDVGAIATNAANAAVADRATVAALAEVAGGVSTNASAVASVSARVGTVENRIAEYHCMWLTNTISLTETNWIPVEWPAPTVWCYAFLQNTVVDGVTNNVQIALPNFAPAENRTLHLVVYKGNNGFVTVTTANGTILSSLTGGSGTMRDCVFIWVEAIGQWIFLPYSMTTFYAIEGAKRLNIGGSSLPVPTGSDPFAPIVGAPPTAQTLSMSPSLSPSLSPVVSEEQEASGFEEEAEELESE